MSARLWGGRAGLDPAPTDWLCETVFRTIALTVDACVVLEHDRAEARQLFSTLDAVLARATAAERATADARVRRAAAAHTTRPEPIAIGASRFTLRAARFSAGPFANAVLVTLTRVAPAEGSPRDAHAHDAMATLDPQCLVDAFRLTRREAEIALHLGRRETVKEVAAALRISTATVRQHAERVRQKLGVARNTEVRAALQAFARDRASSEMSDAGHDRKH